VKFPERVFPRYLPDWFRPVWCVIKGHHRTPLEIPAGMPPGSHINCGCCTKLRAIFINVEDAEYIGAAELFGKVGGRL